MQVLYAIGLLLLFNGKVNSLSIPQDEQDNFSNFEEWLANNALDLFNDLTELGTDDQLDMENAAAYAAMLDHDKWQQLINPEFYQQSLEEVKNLKKINISDLLRCDRLQKALEDMAGIFQETMNLTLTVGDSVNEVVEGINKCKKHMKIKKVWCIVKVIFKAASNVGTSWPHFQAYIKNVKVLAKDIRDVYDYCTHRT